jgi:glycosyltransferase involved in cell wall biosynthesis
VVKVTVLMPVFNSERYLREAIESILNQAYRNFEFLIINDGSTDGSVSIIKSYNDRRIRLIHNERNLGLIHTLNRGIEQSRGHYIARMDADDISLPLRLLRQVAYMERHPDVGICGTWIEYFMGLSDVIRLPVTDAEIKAHLPILCPMAHPTVMFRTAVVRKYGLWYSHDYPHAEDYELWFRAANVTKLANIPEVLLKYRIHPGQICQTQRGEQQATINNIKARYVR